MPTRTVSLGLLLLWAVSAKIQYRNLRQADLAAASALCQRGLSLEAGFGLELEERFERLVLQRSRHAMVVAVDGDCEEVIGFLEIGSLPSPVPRTVTWKGASMEGHPEVPFLANVVVDEPYRRQGKSR